MVQKRVQSFLNTSVRVLFFQNHGTMELIMLCRLDDIPKFLRFFVWILCCAVVTMLEKSTIIVVNPKNIEG